MKKIILVCFLFLLFCSCKDKDSSKQHGGEDVSIETTESEQVGDLNISNGKTETEIRQTAEHVYELCSQYDAVTNWEEQLYKDPLEFEPIYTIQIQDVFLNQKKKPYLFFVRIYDIKKVHSQYLLLANVNRQLDIRHTVYFHLRLICTPETLQEVFQNKLSAINRYALIATINSIEKPDLYIRPAIQSEHLLEDNLLAETHPEDVLDFYDVVLAGSAAFSEPNENTFIITGNCDEIVLIGEDERMDDPSDYERFLESFVGLTSSNADSNN